MQGWFVEYALRYGFPFLGLIGAIAAVVISARPTAMVVWSMVGLAGLIGATQGALRFSTAGLVGACAAAFIFFASRSSTRRQVREGWRRLFGRRGATQTLTISVGIIAASVILITAGTAALLKVRYRQQDALFGGISRFIDDLPAATRIGFWDTDQLFLFYGKRLQRRATYLPLDEYATSDDMLRYLCAQPVDVIAVGPGNSFYELPRPRAWIVEDRQDFERIHGNDPRLDVFVYRLNRSGSTGACAMRQ
jgi:hypothetical protein